jgi:hypothetical protein
MTRARTDGLLFLILGAFIFVSLGTYLACVAPGAGTDFKNLYYAGRGVLRHSDPYNETAAEKLYMEEVGFHPTEPSTMRFIVTRQIYLPTAYTFIVPFALLPWGPAHLLWLTITAALFIFAALLIWNFCADYSPIVSGALLGILLATSVWFLVTGNPAGIVVGLIVIAVWSFLGNRYAWAGVLCLGAALMIKPQDAGLVWLYFLVAGGPHRKRALQTFIVVLLLSIPGTLLVWHASPHWLAEQSANVSWLATRGNVGDPGPTSVDLHDPDSIISLQTVTSLFRDDPRFYNPPAYLLSGLLIALWLIAVLRSKSSPGKDWLALAAISALSMVVGYHRQHDAKILLLAFPAFAMLWAERGMIRWTAFTLTAAALVLNGDLTSIARILVYTRSVAHATGATWTMLTIILCRPVPIILLITGIFYLWVYVRHPEVMNAPAS